ncbi:hypothetical protein [Jeotgalibacillus salarius]|uniref:Uncharacterized protein n=1 Tax=Jeotgalibacillus salarius TaxID=546023 RepID=A0A4Y8LPS0_9BACL|nr:hypothetical protein [Jeotgalibacillus salarius]TFE04001.1 hypothetical protein E2626_01345 [Jeotgalibacillus salarius]
MDKDKFELKVAYDNYQYEITGDFKKIEQHLSLAINHLKESSTKQFADKMKLELIVRENAPSYIEKLLETGQPAIEINSELNQFIKMLGTRIEWIYCLGLGYYAETVNHNTIITAKTLKDLYISADIRAPQNIHLCISQCVKKKYFERIGKSLGQKAYYITPEGKKFIEQQVRSHGEQDKGFTYESDEQKRDIESFMRKMTTREKEMLNEIEVMEEKILLAMALLKNKGITCPVRPHFIYMLMVHVFNYDGLPRSVHLGLSRTRPLTKKIKRFNKVHYMLTDEGVQWANDYFQKNN